MGNKKGKGIVRADCGGNKNGNKKGKEIVRAGSHCPLSSALQNKNKEEWYF